MQHHRANLEIECSKSLLYYEILLLSALWFKFNIYINYKFTLKVLVFDCDVTENDLDIPPLPPYFIQERGDSYH